MKKQEKTPESGKHKFTTPIKELVRKMKRYEKVDPKWIQIFEAKNLHEQNFAEVASDLKLSEFHVRNLYKKALNYFIFLDEFLVRRKLSGKKDFLGDPLNKLELSVGTYNRLRMGGVNSLRALSSHTEESLMTLRQLGKNSVAEIKQFLAKNGLKLAESKSKKK